jgi:DNA (cytosine-5)-methyltransferase 1
MLKQAKLLDLFCGAGGCTKGYQRAGFWVRGVDLKPQPRYVGEEFVQADALEYLRGLIESGEIAEFDAIHASPPCQAFSSLRTMPKAKEHFDLLTPVRDVLTTLPQPSVIENVEGSPILDMPLLGINAITLCGTMFGLGLPTGAELRRHRLFEVLNFQLTCIPRCQHNEGPPIFDPISGYNRPRTVGVWGNSGGISVRDNVKQYSTTERAVAMGIDWMSGDELSQAIPPAYTEFIGRQLMPIISSTTVKQAA